MAGRGTRMKIYDPSVPKQMISILGKPMMQHIFENIRLDAQYIFIATDHDLKNFNIEEIVGTIFEKYKIVPQNGYVDGAAISILYAKDLINNEDPLLIVNSDQVIEWDPGKFTEILNSDFDGTIFTFNSNLPKYSYAKTDNYDIVTQVEEKNVISNNATAGFYFWKHGSDFVKYAESMIHKNIRTNNEFYVAPVYNEAILDGKKINIFKVNTMYNLGSPEDLEHYIEWKKNV